MVMLEPANTVIEICGGFSVVAEVCQRNETRVRRWCYPKERGGTGGLIPSDMQQLLMAAAKKRKWPLKPEHFFPKAEGAQQ